MNRKDPAMDEMLTAAEDYARNIRKFGKPNLTFNQLLYAWHKSMNTPQTDSERPDLLKAVTAAGHSIFKMARAQDNILNERLRIKCNDCYDPFGRPAMQRENMDRLRSYIEDMTQACRQLGKDQLEIQRMIKEMIPEYDQWLKPDDMVAAEAMLIARQLGLDGLVRKQDAEIEQEIKNL